MVVRCSYKHFPALRSLIWPEDIDQLADMYYDYDCSLQYFKDKITDDDVEELQGTIEIKEARRCYANDKNLVDVSKNRILSSNPSAHLQDVIWNIRKEPTRFTVRGVNLDTTLFEGHILLKLPNLSGTIFYRVAVTDGTASAILTTIYRFYKDYEREYTMAGQVWSQGLVEASPGEWQLSLQDY
jgi:hypothetical protein